MPVGGGGDKMLGAQDAGEPARGLAIALGVAAAVVVFLWVQARTSWYLAIDQFGYLSFARDLLAGHVAHPSASAEVLNALLPSQAADALGQTYVLRDGELYSRYAPGFPLLLALASALFGEPAVHEVNAFAMAALLPVMAWLTRRLLGSAWLGLAAALLIVMVPNQLLLWSISPLRDIPCHVFTLSALALLVPVPGREALSARRCALALLLLGYSISMRVDAVLYLLPAGLLLLAQRPWRLPTLAAGAIAFLLGVLPLLVYNAIATGNPLRPTQAMEFEAVLSSLPSGPSGFAAALLSPFAPAEALAAVDDSGPKQFRNLVQGGGFRLSHLARSLPGNLELFPGVFGWLGVVLGGLGALVALFRNRVLAMVTLPYIAVATLFYSFWTRPDSRYLAGALLLFAPLVLFGARFWVAELARVAGSGKARGVALGVAAASLGGLGWYGAGIDFSQRSALPWCEAVLAGSLALGVVLAVAPRVVSGWARQGFVVVLAVALLVVFGWRTGRGLGTRASFQAEQVAEARETFARWVPPGAIVYTSYRYGRPAENINYYTDAQAIYLEELLRWGLPHGGVIAIAELLGRETWLLVTADEARRWRDNPYTREIAEFEFVRSIAPAENRSFFVASPRHRGIPLVLARMTPKREVKDAAAGARAGSR